MLRIIRVIDCKEDKRNPLTLLPKQPQVLQPQSALLDVDDVGYELMLNDGKRVKNIENEQNKRGNNNELMNELVQTQQRMKTNLKEILCEY